MKYRNDNSVKIGIGKRDNMTKIFTVILLSVLFIMFILLILFKFYVDAMYMFVILIYVCRKLYPTVI